MNILFAKNFNSFNKYNAYSSNLILNKKQELKGFNIVE